MALRFVQRKKVVISGGKKAKQVFVEMMRWGAIERGIPTTLVFEDGKTGEDIVITVTEEDIKRAKGCNGGH